MKLRIKEARQEPQPDSETPILAVHYEIQDEDGNLLKESVQAFPLETTADEVREFAARSLAVYKENVERHEEAKKLQASLDNASEVAEALTGLTIE